jgi:N-acetylglutamate synthase-like GNAT family acetyltransferase
MMQSDEAFEEKGAGFYHHQAENRLTRDKEMIQSATEKDFDEIYYVINDAAMAYKGIIPPDRWHEPYMTKEELKKQIDEGVKFSCYLEENRIIGVMGIQDKIDVNLIRHAYVVTRHRNKGIGAILLLELLARSEKPILIGTWKAAHWAIKFYEKHGFHLVTEEEKEYLARRYWDIPDWQVETSVVLADKKFERTKECRS